MANYDKNIGGLVLGLRAVDNQQIVAVGDITGNTITKTQNGSQARSAVAYIDVGGGDGNDSILFKLQQDDGGGFTDVAGQSFVAQDGDSHQEIDINDITQLAEDLRLFSLEADQTVAAGELYISATLVLGGFDVEPQ